MPDLRILYIERNLAQDSIVVDQIGRMSRLIDPHAVAVQVGSFPHFHHPDVTSVRCPFIPKIEAAKGKSFCRSAVQAVRKLIKSGHDYDLIHANFAYPEGLAACRAAEATGRPYVITGRGDDILLYPDDNAYLKRAVEEAVSRCAGFIGVSQHLCDAACRLGTTPDRCTVIPDGIREDTFHWHTDDEPQRHPHTVLFAGDFLPVKNVLHMAQAFTVVAEARPSVHFRLAGRGPTGIDAHRWHRAGPQRSPAEKRQLI
jgi:glycosyltransferase involved in cell wall biosynthesis